MKKFTALGFTSTTTSTVILGYPFSLFGLSAGFQIPIPAWGELVIFTFPIFFYIRIRAVENICSWSYFFVDVKETLHIATDCSDAFRLLLCPLFNPTHLGTQCLFYHWMFVYTTESLITCWVRKKTLGI